MSESTHTSEKKEASVSRVTASGETQRHTGPFADLIALQHTAGNQAVGQLLQGGGQPLDEGTKDAMEARFAADFGKVRVHTDSNADALAKQFSADAVTRGNDVVFREGAYQPGTAGGDRLIAHELTHVIQQQPAGDASNDVGAPGDRFEQEAEAASRSIHGDGPIRATPTTAAPSFQAAINDFIPDQFEGWGESAARSAAGLLGWLDKNTIQNGIEYAINNGVIWAFLKQLPAVAEHAEEIEKFRSQPGAINFLLDVFINPEEAKEKSRTFFTPYLEDGEKLIKDHADVYLTELGVPAEYRDVLWEGLSMLGGFAYSTAEMVLFDVIVDTFAVWNLQSEHDIFEEAWKNYNEGKTDTLDLIAEFIAIVMNLVGRFADIAPFVITLSGGVIGTASGGTVGSVAPGGGTALGGGAGGGTGTGAGLAASEVLGLAMMIGPAIFEQAKLTKAIGELAFKDQNAAQREQDVSQIFTSLIAMIFMAVLAFLPGFAMRMGRKIAEKLKGTLPRLASIFSVENLRKLGVISGMDDLPVSSRPPSSNTDAPRVRAAGDAPSGRTSSPGHAGIPQDTGTRVSPGPGRPKNESDIPEDNWLEDADTEEVAREFPEDAPTEIIERGEPADELEDAPTEIIERGVFVDNSDWQAGQQAQNDDLQEVLISPVRGVTYREPGRVDDVEASNIPGRGGEPPAHPFVDMDEDWPVVDAKSDVPASFRGNADNSAGQRGDDLTDGVWSRLGSDDEFVTIPELDPKSRTKRIVEDIFQAPSGVKMEEMWVEAGDHMREWSNRRRPVGAPPDTGRIPPSKEPVLNEDMVQIEQHSGEWINSRRPEGAPPDTGRILPPDPDPTRQSHIPVSSVVGVTGSAGIGTSAKRKGETTLPENILELEAVKRASSDSANAPQIGTPMKDPRWPADKGWEKKEKVITVEGEAISTTAAGKELGKVPADVEVTVHYVHNVITGEVDDFKIVRRRKNRRTNSKRRRNKKRRRNDQ